MSSKGQCKSQGSFKTLPLFVKTLQGEPEIWEEILYRLHFMGVYFLVFTFPHFRYHLAIPSYSIWLGLGLSCCSGGIKHIFGYY